MRNNGYQHLTRLRHELQHAYTSHNVELARRLTQQYAKTHNSACAIGMAWIKLGILVETFGGDAQQAIKYYKLAANCSSWDARSLALTTLAIIYMRKDKEWKSIDKAYKLFCQIMKEHPYSKSAKQARNFLSLEIFNGLR